MTEVVSICFKQDDQFLIVLPRSSKKTRLFTLIGGKVNVNENLETAIIREVYEELGINIKQDEFELILEFSEFAASDSTKKINMHMFLTEKKIYSLPHANEEIYDYKWFKIGDDESNLCSSIKYHLLNYLKK